MSSGAPRSATPAAGQGGGDIKAVRAQLELMEQDCCRVSAADYNTPFSGLEDAVDRLLPFHMFGAEDPLESDAREAETAAVPSRLAASRVEVWQDVTMLSVNEKCTQILQLERQIKKAEGEALARSQLPLLMLQSYATAEAQAMAVQERNRKADEERKEREKAEAARRAVLEQQAAAAAAAAAAAMAQQQQQQALMAQRQALLLQQQQQAAAAVAARQQQQQAGAAAVQQQQQQQHGMAQQPGQPPGVRPGMPVAGGMTGSVRPLGQPQLAPQQQQAGARPLTAAEIKAQQLAALKARINQRK